MSVKINIKKIILLISFVVCSSVFSAQTVIYVRSNATGTGTSWSNACTLEHALKLASPNTEIWVQQGTHNLSETLFVPNGISLFGGFSGSEINKIQRNYAENPTIIDAKRNFSPVVHLGVGAVLDGFTIQNGAGGGNGGGVYMELNASVENCYVSNIEAINYGGGIYAEGNGLVYNTVILDNKAGIDGFAIFGTTLEVRNVTLVRNDSLPCQMPLITQQPSIINQMAEQNAPIGFPTLFVTVTGRAPLSYQWYSTTQPTAIGGTLIGDAINSNYTPSHSVVGDSLFYVVVSNACGSDTSDISGLHTVIALPRDCNSNTLSFSLGTVSVTGSTVVSGNGILQIWSDAVVVTGCNKPNFDGGSGRNNNADCRSNPDYFGNLFSWCMVMRFADQLCPDDWRVPTRNDFIDLDKAMGGTGLNRWDGVTAADLSKYINTDTNQWSAANYSGVSTEKGLLSCQDSLAYYWSQSEFDANSGYTIHLSTNGLIYPQSWLSKNMGLSLRCIRNSL
jgi:uncharacterized protein (TIGR02145 family)